MGDWLTDTRKSYDTVAVDYAEYTRQALASTPILHTALRFFAESVDGPVADVGCGPGRSPRTCIRSASTSPGSTCPPR